jgi:SAM-dependent methyltransferase
VYVSAFKGDGRSRTGSSTFHRILPRIRALLDDLGHEPRVLDLGCGGGELLAMLAGQRRLGEAAGVDLSPQQVALARERGVDAVVEDAADYLAARLGRFHLITAVDFLEHLRKDELLRLVRAAHDALRPGGCLFVQTPNGQGLLAGNVIYGDLTHETILNPSSLVQLFRYGGLDAVRVEEVAPVGRLRPLWRLLRGLATLAKRIESGKTQRVWTQNMVGVGFRPRGGDG